MKRRENPKGRVFVLSDIRRLYVRKKEGFRQGEESLVAALKEVLGDRIRGAAVYHRYDVDGLDDGINVDAGANRRAHVVCHRAEIVVQQQALQLIRAVGDGERVGGGFVLRNGQ